MSCFFLFRKFFFRVFFSNFQYFLRMFFFYFFFIKTTNMKMHKITGRHRRWIQIQRCQPDWSQWRQCAGPPRGRPSCTVSHASPRVHMRGATCPRRCGETRRWRSVIRHHTWNISLENIYNIIFGTLRNHFCMQYEAILKVVKGYLCWKRYLSYFCSKHLFLYLNHKKEYYDH